MNRQEQLDKLLAEGDGILQTSAVIAAGVPKPMFYQYIRQNDLEQAAHGIYVSRDAWVDGMYLLHLRCVQAVFSHESALFFHDLTDREPSPYSVSVQRGYSPTRLKADGITVYTVKPEYSDAVRSAVPRRKSIKAIFEGSIMIQTARQLKDLIRNLSLKNAADAQILMRNYMMERFLERISLSAYRDIFILKGGMLVAAMVGLDARSTIWHTAASSHECNLYFMQPALYNKTNKDSK